MKKIFIFFILLYFWKISFLSKYSGLTVFSFITLKMSIHCLLACIISDAMSVLIITSIPLYAMCILSLDTLKVVSLFSVLHILNMMSIKKVKVKSLSCVWLFATPWTVAYQAPPSMGFSRQEYWSGLPFPSPGDLPDPGIEPGSSAFQADALTSELLMMGIGFCFVFFFFDMLGFFCVFWDS